MKYLFKFALILFGIQFISAQNFTRKDSLKGGLSLERTCFDVLRYDLNIKVNPDERTVVGYNKVTFKVVATTSKIQIDLFENMQVDSIVFNNNKLKYKREFDAVFIEFPEVLSAESEQSLLFYYSGKPMVAKNAPWDGGFIFKKDRNGKPWIAVACQGTGASLFYPVKDSQSDEPDYGATVKIAVPNGLMNVSNGRLIGSQDLNNGYTRWDWEVKNPINTYSITVNIGDYINIHENYKGLDLDYYVLRDNETAARMHFEEVKPMMDCFQSKFGTYPFANDSYKLVETPYLGMEHQGAVSYGNKFLKGYLGNDRSGTGIGLLFDYIIIHETGHEWFGNSITSKDTADMWIHEGFTTYSEAVYVECQYGYEKGQKYINGLKQNVENEAPIIGSYGVNNEGSNDMYDKGALFINTLRHVVNDDTKWWKMLAKYAETFRHKIIDTETVVRFFNEETGMDLTPVFNQYLRHSAVPKLELRISKGKLQSRWNADEDKFNMPVDLKIKGQKIRIYPVTTWTTSKIKINSLENVELLSDDFYINMD
jgi:aminopeptidase N